MASNTPSIFIGDTKQHRQEKAASGEYVHLFNKPFYKISNYDAMPAFFMSLVSSSNHWMFIASTGGLSAGRINADHALFPITRSINSPKTLRTPVPGPYVSSRKLGASHSGNHFQFASREFMRLNEICTRIFREVHWFLKSSTMICS